MDTRFRPVIVVLACLVLSACSGDDPAAPRGPRPTEAVLAFVDSQDVPLLRGTTQLAIRADLEFFRTEFGEPMDCQAGSVFLSANGLRLGERVGWLYVDGEQGFLPDRSAYFDVAAADTTLFATDLWDDLGTGFPGRDLVWNLLLPLLAADPDTPPGTLLAIAGRLDGHIEPWVASRLLENPVARQDEAILQILASLPVFQGDPYADVRSRAREHLGLDGPG